ncbi:hypothetical protein I4U23_017271 [Adineta vaga]|nr:hypothetical protein I4U23_017271 [Adineta vaga]
MSYDVFITSGGHVRRRALIQMKDKQTKLMNDLVKARENVSQCSFIEDPLKWNQLFDIVLTSELQRFEDCQKNIHKAKLPYSS